ncbi:S9 family peptidase [Microbacterium sp. NPDC055357]
MKPLDLVDAHRVAALSVTPDGAQIIYARERPSLLADAYTSQLWVVSAAGGAARRLTRGTRDLVPAVSPDGTLLAFLRSAGGRPQLHVMPLQGGESFAVTDQPLGVERFSWAPDSRRVVFTARVPATGRYGTADGVSPDSEPARRIESLKYRADGVGYDFDRPAHVFVVAVDSDGPAPRVEELPADGYDIDGHGELAAPLVPDACRLTEGARHHDLPVFAEDGTSVLYVVVDGASLATAVESVPAGDSPARPVVIVPEDRHLQVTGLLPHAGAIWLLGAELGESGTDFVGRQASVYRGKQDGSGLTRLVDVDAIDAGEPGTPLIADPVGDGVLTLTRARGSIQAVRVADDGALTVLTAGAHDVKGISAGGETIAVAVAGPDSLEEVATLHDGTLVRRTDVSAALRQCGVVVPQERVYTSPDGTPVHGWVLLPEGDGPHPALLMIHGGPFAQYTGAYFDEAQVYAAAGYAVVMCNPRGSSSYGEAHARAVIGGFGTVDRDDILAFFDGALDEFDELDAGRTGIMGGSYGGYMTAWIVAHDHRFRGAIVERGFLDPLSFAGTSDIGWFFGHEYLGTDASELRAQSPMARVDDVRTPTLVIHSEKDLRCPIEAAERYHDRLRRNGVPTSFLVFPGENHGLSRNGRPRHRVQRFQAILDWWAEHLPLTEA